MAKAVTRNQPPADNRTSAADRYVTSTAALSEDIFGPPTFIAPAGLLGPICASSTAELFRDPDAVGFTDHLGGTFRDGDAARVLNKPKVAPSRRPMRVLLLLECRCSQRRRALAASTRLSGSSNKKLIQPLSRSELGSHPSRLLATTRPGFLGILWVAVFRKDLRIRATLLLHITEPRDLPVTLIELCFSATILLLNRLATSSWSVQSSSTDIVSSLLVSISISSRSTATTQQWNSHAA